MFDCAYTNDMVTHNMDKVRANGTPVAITMAKSESKGEANGEDSNRICGLPRRIILS